MRLLRLLLLPLTLIASLFTAALPARAGDVQVGVYYFPGWREEAVGSSTPQPWQRIKNFKEREPQIGWYDEGNPDVMRQQIDMMVAKGLKFVVFDWYWQHENRVFIDHALSNYFKAPNRSKLPFALMWANHGDTPKNFENFDRMLGWWIRFYADRPEFLRIDGKPVIILFSGQNLDVQAKRFGMSGKELISYAQRKAQASGLPGFYFVAGSSGDDKAFLKQARTLGYSAISTYNMHRAPFVAKASHSYKELDEAYRAHWQLYRADSSVPVFLPFISGWDNRPWGGSEDPLHDNSQSTANEFEAHLLAGRKVLDAMPASEPRLGVICCWNEFGEGSFIEPTKAQGTAYLDRVKKVFSTP